MPGEAFAPPHVGAIAHSFSDAGEDGEFDIG
jgi:hypothetical protein